MVHQNLLGEGPQTRYRGLRTLGTRGNGLYPLPPPPPLPDNTHNVGQNALV